MTPIGPGGGAEAPFSHHGGGAPLARRLWWIPAIRGAIAVALGVLVIATGSRRAALVNFLGSYWLFSAVLTIARALRTRWKRGSRPGLWLGWLAWWPGCWCWAPTSWNRSFPPGSCSMRLVSRRS
jgi:hypothetical protein